MARQSHRPSGSNDPQEQVPPPTMHTGKDPQRQHRAGEFEFEWDASRREANRPERPDPAPASVGQSTKRRRIALACNVCRARKSKACVSGYIYRLRYHRLTARPVRWRATPMLSLLRAWVRVPVSAICLILECDYREGVSCETCFVPPDRADLLR
jgi:hypothetical protein